MRCENHELRLRYTSTSHTITARHELRVKRPRSSATLGEAWLFPMGKLAKRTTGTKRVSSASDARYRQPSRRSRISILSDLRVSPTLFSQAVIGSLSVSVVPRSKEN